MSSSYDYSRWPNFSKKELLCQHTGEENPNKEEFITLMDKVQELRSLYGKPMRVTSGYRSPEHPIEAKKTVGGQHTIAAIDLQVPVEDYYEVAMLAFQLGFSGIGFNCKGRQFSRFIHLDLRPMKEKRIWSY